MSLFKLNNYFLKSIEVFTIILPYQEDYLMYFKNSQRAKVLPNAPPTGIVLCNCIEQLNIGILHKIRRYQEMGS